MNESLYLINFIYNNFLNIVIIILVIIFILIVFNVYDINFENAFSKRLSKSFKLESFDIFDPSGDSVNTNKPISIKNINKCDNGDGNNIDLCNLYDTSANCREHGGRYKCSWNGMSCISESNE